MPIEIRMLRADDAGILGQSGAGIFDDPIDVEATRSFLEDPRHHLALALCDGEPVGFVSAVHYVHPDKPRPELWINEVGVVQSHRGRGLGKQLMHAMLQQGRSLGCSEAWVMTERGNTAANRLYAASGGIKAAEDFVMYEYELSV